MNLKKLSHKAFIILLVALVGSIVFTIINSIRTFSTLDAEIAIITEEFFEAGLALDAYAIRALTIAFAVTTLVVGLALETMWLLFAFRHRNKASRGIYLIVLLTFNSLGAFLNFLIATACTCIYFNPANLLLSLIGLTLNVLIIVAYCLQQKAPAEPPQHSYYVPDSQYVPPGYYPNYFGNRASTPTPPHSPTESEPQAPQESSQSTTSPQDSFETPPDPFSNND